MNTRGASRTLVLASSSSVRKDLLESAGLTLVIDAADVDERALPGETETARAIRLAESKARAVALRHPGALVIGADQVGFLDDDTPLAKPQDVHAARAQLLRMSGRAHTFVSAAAIVKGDLTLASVREDAHVTFRALTDDDVTLYVAHDEWKGSCGGYQIEHRGITLVDEVRGSFHAVLGFPLVSMLRALRAIGV